MPEIFEASLEVTAPEAVKINCIGIAKSGNTPDEGITAPLLYVEDGLEANLLEAEGKILLLTGAANPEVLKRMRESGAVGYIACHGSIYDPEEMIPELRTRSERRKKTSRASSEIGDRNTAAAKPRRSYQGKAAATYRIHSESL